MWLLCGRTKKIYKRLQLEKKATVDVIDESGIAVRKVWNHLLNDIEKPWKRNLCIAQNGLRKIELYRNIENKFNFCFVALLLAQSLHIVQDSNIIHFDNFSIKTISSANKVRKFHGFNILILTELQNG